jgi:galactonate dehydratase
MNTWLDRARGLTTGSTRRSVLQSAILAPFALSRSEAADQKRTTIESVEIHRVKVNNRGNWVLVRLRTNNGLTGVGDASHGGPDAAKLQWIPQFFEHIKGRSIGDVEWLRTRSEPAILKGGSAVAIAMSSLEMAMWDLQGKALAVPAYELFGGRLRESVRNYANINRSTEERSPEGFARSAEGAIAAGFDAIKLAPFDDMPKDLSNATQIEEFTKLGIARSEAVRKAIGPKVDLLLDVHSHMDVPRGIELARRLEHLNLFWLEEVVPAKPVENLAKINAAASMPTAGGESIYGVRGFLPYISARAVDITMPDVKYCGGMLELKKIAAVSEAAGMPVAPHGPASPVGNMAAAHVCVTVPNFHILEFSHGEVPWRSEIVDPPEQVVKGMLTPSSRPGLGLTLNDKLLQRYRVS